MLLEPLFQLLSEKNIRVLGLCFAWCMFYFPWSYLPYRCYIANGVTYIKNKNVEIHEGREKWTPISCWNWSARSFWRQKSSINPQKKCSMEGTVMKICCLLGPISSNMASEQGTSGLHSQSFDRRWLWEIKKSKELSTALGSPCPRLSGFPYLKRYRKEGNAKFLCLSH